MEPSCCGSRADTPVRPYGYDSINVLAAFNVSISASRLAMAASISPIGSTAATFAAARGGRARCVIFGAGGGFVSTSW